MKKRKNKLLNEKETYTKWMNDKIRIYVNKEIGIIKIKANINYKEWLRNK